MSTSRLKQITAQYRKELEQHDAYAARTLTNAYQHTLAQIQPKLNTLYKEMADKRKAGQQVPPSWLYEQRRLETIKQEISAAINHYGQLTQAQVADLQRVGASLGQQSAQQSMQASVPRGISHAFGVPDQRALHNLVSATQPGSPLHDLFNTFGAQAADDVSKALLTGLTLGNSPVAVARDVAAALDIPRWRALTIARTEMLRAYRDAQLENFRANSDVVDTWIWSCELSANTCAACIFMNGSEHSLDEDMDSHVNCRCAMIPKTKSWADLLSDTGIDTSDLEDTSPDIVDGSDWFDAQSEDTQREILGNAKYEVYQNGTPLRDFVGVKSDPDWGDSVYVKSLKQAKGN